MQANKENINPALRKSKPHKGDENPKCVIEKSWYASEHFNTVQKCGEQSDSEIKERKVCKSALKFKASCPSTNILEVIKARKYGREYFETQKSKQIGVSTLFKRQTTIINLSESPDIILQSKYEKQFDTNEQIPNMDVLLNKIDKNTSLKVNLEKAIIEFNKAPSKGLDFLWKEQIVLFALLSQ